jgi:phosphoadenosine phosphosulfate reductase
MNDLRLSELNQELSDKSIDERLEKLATLFKGEIIFTTSFGIEDQVITHKIFSNNLDIKVVTLDTGRLFPETYEVFAQTMIRYNKKIDVYFPDSQEVEDMVTSKGPLSFYKSLGDRMECCRIRKVGPLNRALAGMKCWISGIRSDQSDNRNSMEDLEYDEVKGMYKYHPLFNWSFKEVEKYIMDMHIPYNTLHDQGFLSIGCQPCTRAVREGEDFRAGRWWWEKEGPKECGCHLKEE